MAPTPSIFSGKVIKVYIVRFRGYYGKKVILRPKLSFLRSSANIALNAHFLAKNHFFTITTSKPGYIYPKNFF